MECLNRMQSRIRASECICAAKPSTDTPSIIGLAKSTGAHAHTKGRGSDTPKNREPPKGSGADYSGGRNHGVDRCQSCAISVVRRVPNLLWGILRLV